jgi:hypothetical protein
LDIYKVEKLVDIAVVGTVVWLEQMSTVYSDKMMVFGKVASLDVLQVYYKVAD